VISRKRMRKNEILEQTIGRVRSRKRMREREMLE
jgi:hypothetical protein